jgi:hypothetical protein
MLGRAGHWGCQVAEPGKLEGVINCKLKQPKQPFGDGTGSACGLEPAQTCEFKQLRDESARLKK